jgi:predicted SAM-dependent methyltransferase
MKRLNLGSGDQALDGFTNLDGKSGDSLFPLDVADGSIDEIRASHVLEHFSHRDVMAVLKHWVSKLVPGGLLKIAVPDFEKIARDYLDGKPVNVQGYVYGGHVDERDRHNCGFDTELLSEMMLDCGLERLHHWTSEIDDCAALPITLNVAGYKPSGAAKQCANTVAVLSAPRFGPVMHFRCASTAFGRARVPYQIMGGAYWHQVMSEVLESQIADPEIRYVITCDYDTVFTYADVVELYRLMEADPAADAIFPLESKRGSDHALFGILGKDGKPIAGIGMYQLARNLLPVTHGHFGLTILRADSLRSFARPWMNSSPNAEGRWGDGKKDADIDFWHRWVESGRTLFLAPRVVVGHLQEMITWPGRDLRPIYQLTKDYDADGMPQEARR